MALSESDRRFAEGDASLSVKADKIGKLLNRYDQDITKIDALGLLQLMSNCEVCNVEGNEITFEKSIGSKKRVRVSFSVNNDGMSCESGVYPAGSKKPGFSDLKQSSFIALKEIKRLRIDPDGELFVNIPNEKDPSAVNGYIMFSPSGTLGGGRSLVITVSEPQRVHIVG